MSTIVLVYGEYDKYDLPYDNTKDDIQNLCSSIFGAAWFRQALMGERGAVSG